MLKQLVAVVLSGAWSAQLGVVFGKSSCAFGYLCCETRVHAHELFVRIITSIANQVP